MTRLRLVLCVVVLSAPALAFVVHGPRAATVAAAVASTSRAFPAVSTAEMQPFERPGNYVQPYGSALGVSVAAVLCGELIRVPGTADVAVSVCGRLAGTTSLPLLGASLAVLRAASFTGPALLATLTCQRLNLGIALSSVAACIIGSPRPVLSVVVARVGTALLCLEVWSKFSGANAGDPVSEVTTALKSTAQAVRRTIDLFCAGLGGGAPDGAEAAVTSSAVTANYAALALVQIAIALAVCASPSAAVPALYPVASPGSGAARNAASSAILSAVCATTLADAAATRTPHSSGQQQLQPFRWLNRAMLASASAALAVQAGAAGLMGAGAVRSLGRAAIVAMAAAQLVQLATVAVCVQQDSTWSI